MERPPRVSVIVATYRSRPSHLRRAIDSALGQSLREIEVVVSDDSPDDGLRALVDDFADPRCRYFWNPRPRLPARNHATALSLCRAPLAAILNHDDFWMPEFLETLVPPLEGNGDAVLSFCDQFVVQEDGVVDAKASDDASSLWGRAGLAEGVHAPFHDLLAAQGIAVAGGCVFRTSALPPGEPRDEAGPAYDLWLTYLLARTGRPAIYSARRLHCWRLHPGNLSGAPDPSWIAGGAFTWEAVLADPAMTGIAGIARRKASDANRQLALHRSPSGSRGAAASHALRALRLQPGARNLLALLSCALPSGSAARLRGAISRLAPARRPPSNSPPR
jgi:hypothetical protein